MVAQSQHFGGRNGGCEVVGRGRGHAAIDVRWFRSISDSFHPLHLLQFVVDTSFQVLIFCGTIPFALVFRVESEVNSDSATSSSETHDEGYTPGEDSSGGSSTSRSSGASGAASTSSQSGGGKGSASSNSSTATSSKNSNNGESKVEEEEEEDEDEDLSALSLERLLGKDAKLAKEVRRADKIMMNRMNAAVNDVANRVGWRSNITQKPKTETKREGTGAILKEEEEKKVESGLADGSETGRPGPAKPQLSWGPKNDVDEVSCSASLRLSLSVCPHACLSAHLLPIFLSLCLLVQSNLHGTQCLSAF